MIFEDMNPLQRRLHNAAIVLESDGDEFGFVGLLRETIDEIQRMQPRQRGPAHSCDIPGCAVCDPCHGL